MMTAAELADNFIDRLAEFAASDRDLVINYL
jgi:hypothetical protein